MAGGVLFSFFWESEITAVSVSQEWFLQEVPLQTEPGDCEKLGAQTQIQGPIMPQ